MGNTTKIGLILACSFGVELAAQAAPSPGEMFPSFEARDLSGARTRFQSLLSGRPTLVVAITDRKAGDEMRQWFEAATETLGEYNLVSIVSVDIGWFSSRTVRGWASKRVPEQWRSRTLFDSNQRMGKLLALEGELEGPWVFVLDAEGRVLASANGPLSPTRAQALFEAYAAADR